MKASDNAPEIAGGVAPWEPWLLLALAIPVAILLVCCFSWPLYVDEAYSALVATKSLSQISHMLAHDTNLPLYLFILHFWVKVAGISEVALRAPSLPFFLLAAWVTSAVARQGSGNRRAGFYAAFFYLASSEAIYQSMLARTYALLGLLAALSLFFFLEGFVKPKQQHRAEWGYFATNVAGTFTHPWYFFLFPAQALACVILIPRRRWSRVAANQIASLIPFTLLWGRKFLGQMRNGGTAWMPHLHSIGFAATALTQFYVGGRIGIAFLLVCLGLVVARPGGWSRSLALVRKPEYAILVITTVVSLGVPLLISLVHPIYVPDRYSIIALPALAAGLGWALSDIAPRRWLATWCWVIVAGYGTIAVLQATGRGPGLVWMGGRLSQGFEAGADRAAAATICRSASPGDSLIFTSLSGTAMEYYLNRQGCSLRLHLFTFPPSIEVHPGWDWRHHDPRILDADAERLAAQVASVHSPRRRAQSIWVFQGFQKDENTAIDQGLTSRFQLTRTLSIDGSMFRGVEVFDSVPAKQQSKRKGIRAQQGIRSMSLLLPKVRKVG